jgi:hypothetical protein
VRVAIFEKLSERKMRLKWESRYSKAEIVREKGGLEVRVAIFEKLSERKMRLKWESRYSTADIVRGKDALEEGDAIVRSLNSGSSYLGLAPALASPCSVASSVVDYARVLT